MFTDKASGPLDLASGNLASGNLRSMVPVIKQQCVHVGLFTESKLRDTVAFVLFHRVQLSPLEYA